ncbi:MAG: DsbC family protein [Prolixibacteraceae bacterium]|nr:DsbC family protein [Burkholderiales bacterium]
MKNVLLLSAIYLFAPQLAAAEDYEELRRNLTEKMPQVTIGEIRKLPYADLYEIQGNGVNIFYTDAKGEVALFGNLMELQTRANLSEQRKQELMVVDFSQLPLDKAIVKVKGSGARKLAVFSDPDCPYCKQLEQELKDVTDVTIYTFLYPLADLHPDAPRKARLIWCASDRAQAWEQFMFEGREPAAAGSDCEAPIGAVADIAKKFWITGTPGMVFVSGKLVPGVIPRAQIETLLNPDGKS